MVGGGGGAVLGMVCEPDPEPYGHALNKETSKWLVTMGTEVGGPGCGGEGVGVVINLRYG